MTPPNGSAPSRDPLHYAVQEADAAHVGMCCAKEMATALAAIAELASRGGRTLADDAKQFSKIKRKALQAGREAVLHLSMLTREHAKAEGMCNALKANIQSPFNGLGLLEAFTAMHPDAKDIFLAMAREYSGRLPERRAGLRLVSSEGRTA